MILILWSLENSWLRSNLVESLKSLLVTLGEPLQPLDESW